MVTKNLIEFTSVPLYNLMIDEEKIENLKKLLHNFDFLLENNCYNFVYENMYIVVSNYGVIVISSVFIDNTYQNICLISKLVNNINSIISVSKFSTKIHTRQLNLA